jgi:iron(III) transport system substrate-binding protein
VKWLTRVLAVVVALSAAACGGAGGGSDPGEVAGPRTVVEVLSAVEGLDGEARAAKLVELARDEGGTLTWYTSSNADEYGQIAEAFEEAYGIAVSVYRAGSSDLAERLSQEADANAVGADVVKISSEYARVLSERGLLAPYSSEYKATLPEGTFADDWSGYDVSLLVVSRNTDLLTAEDAPRSWEDLADPRWDGQLVIDPGDVDWYATLWTYWVEEAGKSEEEADQLFEQVAANTVFFEGHTAQAELLAAAEFALGVNFADVVDPLAAEGAPLAWEPSVEPAVADISSLAALAEGENPAAAVLFVDWLLSEPGQAALVGAGSLPVLTGLGALELDYVLVDSEALVATIDDWTERFDRLAQLGTLRESEG